MISESFAYDVFLGYSSKDRSVVRDVAERLRSDDIAVWFDEWEIKPGDSIPIMVEEGLEHSRVLVLCISENAFGSDWSQLEPGTFRFRDPLNKQRRILLLRLSDVPIKGSLSQFLHLDWFPGTREQGYARLVDACRSIQKKDTEVKPGWLLDVIAIAENAHITDYAFSTDGKRAITCDWWGSARVWDLTTGKCTKVLQCINAQARHVEWGSNQQVALFWLDEENVYLIDIDSDRIVADYGNAVLTKRQMDCFRLLAGGLSSRDIQSRLGLWVITVEEHLIELKKRLGFKTRNEVRELATHFYGLGLNPTYPPLRAKFNFLPYLAHALETERALSGDGKPFDNLRLCTKFGIREQHANNLPTFAWDFAWKRDWRHVAFDSGHGAIELWDALNGIRVRTFEGHTAPISSIAWHPKQRFLLSGSLDETVRLWDSESGICLYEFGPFQGGVKRLRWIENENHALVGAASGLISVLDLAEFVSGTSARDRSEQRSTNTPEQVQYTNAKVLIVGDTHSGKTGLTHRLATGAWRPTDESTVGAWSTQWQLKDTCEEQRVEREIWLWDFGGQADQRLIHQLYMDRTALILLLFNADQEDVLPGLRDWLTALRRSVEDGIPQFLVAGRIDTGFKASRGKLQTFASEQGLAYYETSAKSGDGCDLLRSAIIAGIPWGLMEKRTTPRIFKLIKDEILKLRDEGQVLHTFKELREILWRRLPDELHFTDATLQTVIGLLDGPGVVKELEYGTYILLAPEWINAYAQAVIRTLRSADNDLGVLPLRSIAEGKLIYQSIGRDGSAMEMKRLPPAEERVVLGEMEHQLEQRRLCLRQGDKLVFPSHCGRDRPTLLAHPPVFVSYTVQGFLDDIYATLVVKLSGSESFKLAEPWRDAADFVTLHGGFHMGIKLTRESGSNGVIGVYFGPGVTEQEQVIFATYIHAHLEKTCEHTQRLRHYVCPKCNASKGNAEVLMRKLLAKKLAADTECDGCGVRFPLWDALEQRFASAEVRKQMEDFYDEESTHLDTRRQGKLLALEVGARITSADQKWFEIPGTEDEGIDIEMEFTSDEGQGTGRRLYLQLKSGNSFLTCRKSDGVKIFRIKKPEWVQQWIQQPYPVMLVIGTFPEDSGRTRGKNRLEFEEVRWMEITSVLKRLSKNGTQAVKQIEFKGERMDMASIHRWRKRILSGEQF